MEAKGSKDNPIKINNWEVVGNFTPYTAPECLWIALQGDGVDHPAIGTDRLRTTSIVDTLGRLVKTKNNWYELENPSEKYLKYLEEKNIVFDPENPIKMRG